MGYFMLSYFSGGCVLKEWSLKEVESIVQLSSLINSSLHITDVLSNSMRVVEELMDAEASSIFEIDHNTSELYFRLARGTGKGSLKEIRFTMGEGIAGWVASSGEPLVVPDTAKDRRFSKKVDSISQFRTRSIIAVPIIYRGRTTGVIEVINKRGPAPFDDNSMDVLTIVAGQIGIAIENARLYERLKDKFALTASELKKTQAQLIHSERMAALGQLTQGVAHVVRNPVMSIGGFTRRLKKKLPSDDSAAEYIEVILDETARLEQIVKDVGEYTSMPKPDLKKVKLSNFLQSVIAGWQKSNSLDNIKIETMFMPENPPVFVDVYLMSRAVSNLLQNAGDALSEGGTISLSTGWDGKWLVISVKDDGGGISGRDLPHVFDPFFTSKTYGSGLGLTTVNRIVQEHHGEVKIISAPEAGTEAKIYLQPSSGSNL
jgi:signal transduction histidine kinase